MQIQAYLVAAVQIAAVQNLKRLVMAASGGIFDLITKWIETISIGIHIGKIQKLAA